MATSTPSYEEIEPGKEWELNDLLIHIAKELKEENLEEIKFRLSGEGGIPKRDLSEMNTALKLFTSLKETRRISNDNTLFLQTILWHTNRKDLYEKACKWAKDLGDSLYFYQPDKEEQVNGYKHVQFHVRGRTGDFMRSNLEALRANVARLLMIPPECVLVCGLEKSNSVMVTFLIPEQTVERLKESFFECSGSFSHLGVDEIRFDIWNPRKDTEQITETSSHKVDIKPAQDVCSEKMEEKIEVRKAEDCQLPTISQTVRKVEKVGIQIKMAMGGTEGNIRKRQIEDGSSLQTEPSNSGQLSQNEAAKRAKITPSGKDAMLRGAPPTQGTAQIKSEKRGNFDNSATDSAVTGVLNEGDLQKEKHTTPKSGSAWTECTKYPGHEGFIPITDFSLPHLPQRFQRQEILDYIKVWADLTVRLRVQVRSKRSGGATHRLGTAFINSVIRLEKDCICEDCKAKGIKDKEWWCINLNGAANSVYDKEEADTVKIDFFYDSRQSMRNGKMKTLRGVKMLGATDADGFRMMMCATHDEDLGSRLQEKWDQAMRLLSKLGSKTFTQPEPRPNKVMVCISHPHGVPKQVSVGELKHQGDLSDDAGSILGRPFGIHDQRLEYTTQTCGGSSGAIVLCLDDLVSDDISERFSSTCMHLYATEASPLNVGLCRKVESLERYINMIMQKGLMKSMLEATRSSALVC